MMKPLFQALLVLALAAVSTAPVEAQSLIPRSRAEIALSFAPVVRKAAPAVVNIYARRVVEQRRSPFADDPFFRDFFRDFGQVRPQVQNSLGSGVVLSDDGIVVSNYHVVGQAEDIRVVLNDRREFSARVLLADAESDLAILRIEGAPGGMAHLDLRDSDSVEVGELVLAIGNPFGVGQTVSSGIVSGLARSGTATGNGRGYFIQTDAPINPGNSGGALIDLNGELIGVNTSILTRSGGSNGIGFAIPSALVAQFVDQAQAGKTRFERPWAGMTGQEVDAGMAETLGLDRPGGVIVAALHPASPFAEAGLETGDVITSVDGMSVNTPPEMIFRMSVAGLGAKARVGYVRGGRERSVDVRLIAAPDAPPRNPLTTGPGSAIPGLRLETVNPAVAAEHGLEPGVEGVLIADSGPFGGRVGLLTGDVVQRVNGATVTESAALAEVLSTAERRLDIGLVRGGRRMTLRLRL
ncbi:periplasmic serine protease, DO/DeqQ family protein [Pseudooceanicola batsensis HTCC2597]|uniref:Periplasmic serine protease, DO/DeqQ family protein n=1 Tax=Pseudooceanicola batsensis (strain ATCC BAA-863 / DSM 15984 / KCTC 12145 / HTCC2597) TaxID=252305 RepID=A3TU42_PSEBH|nr:trypsin-like peptidase domain-containing protein [Pseudooceanicola batsensis]EAQ05169.1 periplasmic serine protease, DO/DeqQ family protein [Pseudooceanicola batsensis HTCC2597]